MPLCLQRGALGGQLETHPDPAWPWSRPQTAQTGRRSRGSASPRGTAPAHVGQAAPPHALTPPAPQSTPGAGSAAQEPRTPRRTRVDAQAKRPRAQKGEFPSRGQWNQSWPCRGGRLQAVSRGGPPRKGLGLSRRGWGSWREITADAQLPPAGKLGKDGVCSLSPSPARLGREGGPSPQPHRATSSPPT